MWALTPALKELSSRSEEGNVTHREKQSHTPLGVDLTVQGEFRDRDGYASVT